MTGTRRLPCLGLFACAGMASAQPPVDNPPPKDDIVVTGRNADAASIRREARDYVRRISPPPVDGQFARWNDPLCIAVVGIAAPLAGRLRARIHAIALTAGAPVGKDGCRPNAFVTFTADARALLARLERREPGLLAGMPLADRRPLRAEPRAIRWWYGTHARGSDGNEFQSGPGVAFGPIGSSGPAIPASDRTRFGDRYRSSLIDTGLQVDIASAVVLIDVPLATGRPLDAVADYAAFVILARVRPGPPAGGAPTILNLFADGGGTDALTGTDRAYLAALYAMPANRTARTQANLLVGATTRARSGREEH